METEKCTIENCENKEMASKLWNGKRYCIEHYNEFIWEELICHYNKWNTGEPAPDKFKSFLGRMYDEDYFKNIGESYLSQARIRDRGFNFIKTVNGCTFEITRHHNAWEGLGKVKKVVEKWKVDINEKTFFKVAERKFKKSDYDF